jgi:glycyl-tRNA synthetase
MAEIEHFVDPEDKSHIRFNEVKDIKLRFLNRTTQSQGKSDLVELTVGEAVEKQVVANQTLGYFVARIYSFLLKIGIDPQRLRFRQHMANEMAHYATDCWDAEIYMQQYGWIECVGCADRAAYDLTVHAKKTGAPLVVRQALKEPIVTQQEVPEFDKKLIGKTFGKETGNVTKIVGEMSQEELVNLKSQLANG